MGAEGGPVLRRLRLDAPTAAGRLDAWLAGATELSRSQLQRLIKAGHVTVDGVEERIPRRRLFGGEQVQVAVPPPPPSELVAQDIPVPVLHLDDDLVVVDKPADLVVHPARGHPDGTLVNALLHLIAGARADGDFPTDPARPGIVHRLDRGTSGVMVVARTPEALTHLAGQFAARTVQRRYLALVWGRLSGAAGTVDAPLGRHPGDRLRVAVQPRGKRAVTHWRVVDEAVVAGQAFSLVACRLETGRTHQIRVHMHHLGKPLVGDPLYGRRRAVPGPVQPHLAGVDRQLLHAAQLGFEHPGSGAHMAFQTGVPLTFQRVLDAFGLKV